jgi:nicotinate-nucleotide adenylyltransferase
MRMGNRIGIFGGSFDPIHNGHLLLAELCCESLGLDKVLFLLASVSPFKVDKQPASNKDRAEMLRLAIGGNCKFELDFREIERGGVSFTIDSVRSIAAENPSAELFLLMGADALADISKWREPAELFRLVTPCVIARGGVGEPNWAALEAYIEPSRLEEIIRNKVVGPQIEISSFDLRQRIKQCKSVRYQVPYAVDVYLKEHSLYRTSFTP